MGSDTEAVILIDTGTISILVPRMGSDHKYSHSANIVCNFNSRSPYGERLNQYVLVKLHFIFQFSLPAWRATGIFQLVLHRFEFSIHAPRMKSDIYSYALALSAVYFSIHAPRMKSDGGRIFL